MTAGPDPQATYAADLRRFVALCHALVDAGQAYAAVVLSHELYRYLYPVEPYADFKHTEPVPYLLAHIRRLLAMGASALESVHGYPHPEASWRPADAAREVETTTSDLYSDLWLGYDAAILTQESRKLVERRIPAATIEAQIAGRSVLDLGCGSGRYAIALAMLGAASVTAVDFQAKSYAKAAAYCAEHALPVTFREADVLHLPFADRAFDFVFCNGVLHHTRSWQAALDEYLRVMRRSGFLYLYATGGMFWSTRRALRTVFERIPRPYAAAVLQLIGMPGNRMVFLDTWYVPIEEHLPRADLEAVFSRHGVRFTKLMSDVDFDPDSAIARGVPGAAIVWGEGEHRYLIER